MTDHSGTPSASPREREPVAWRYRLTLPGENPRGWVYTEDKAFLPRRPDSEWEVEPLYLASGIPTGSQDGATDAEIALLNGCAIEYEDSARACDTPQLARLRERRTKVAAELRALASRLREGSPA